MLQLPSLHTAIPMHLQPQSSRQRCARLANAVFGAGLIRAEHVRARGTDNYLPVAQRALQDWINERLTGLRCLRPRFTMVVGDLDLDDSFGTLAGHHDGAVIEWFGYGDTFDVGPELERLEALHPRLGMTVLSAFEEAAWKTLPIYTPLMVLEAACDTYWCGDDDEEQAVEMSCQSEQEMQDMRENMVTRKMVDATYPQWALGYRRRRRNIGTRTLKVLRDTLSDGRARALIDDVLALRKLTLPRRDWSDREGRFMGYAGLLTWGKQDRLSLRVVDDYQQMIGESGDYFEDSGREFIRLDEPQALSSWMASMVPWCAALKLVDGLLHKLCRGS